MNGILFPIGIGFAVWYFFIRKPKPGPVPPIDDIPKPKPDEPDVPPPDEPAPKPKPQDPDSEPCEHDGTCAPFARNPDELRYVGTVVQNMMGKTGPLSERMPTHTTPIIDASRKALGGAPIMRGWRDQDANQSDLSWQTNLCYWILYPKGPLKLRSSRSGYAAAWLRIRRYLRDGLDAAGIPYTV